MKRRHALCLAALAAGCTQTQATPGARAPARAGRPTPDLEVLLGRMTLKEKLGQMTQPDHGAIKAHPEDVRTLFLGSVLSGGDSLAVPNTAAGWADLYDRYQEQALQTRLGIPLVYGLDAVHGFNGLRGAVIFPHNIGLGATRDPALVEKAARITALEVAGTGVDWTFAPCIAVPRNERWGRTYEGFGETAELAEAMGAASVRGYQTPDLGAATALLATAKHFVGDGGTAGGKDQGDTVATEEELRRIHLPGYRAAIAAGVGSIMVSYSSIGGRPMHGSRHLVTEVLKGELGFQGFVVTDYNGIDKIAGDYRTQVETAVNAGIDMFMEPVRYRDFLRTLEQLVTEGRVPTARIDDAVRRILRQKARLRLWERPFADRSLAQVVGAPAHRAVARQAVAESLVLLKNAHALPIARDTPAIHVAGSRADDLGAQCGGWAIGWQGKRGPITDGTTILEGIKKAAPRATVTFSADGPVAAGAKIVVAVVGEDPYAESKGDREDLSLSPEDRALIARLRHDGRPLVVILLSGRPLLLGPVLDQADAVLAAWLPGTEGAGVADVLFGDRAPTGKLPHSWPRSMEQLPLNVGDSSYAPQFPYGFGLGY
jgi:beta-glucosidase